jgi:hypothetical protein
VDVFHWLIKCPCHQIMGCHFSLHEWSGLYIEISVLVGGVMYKTLDKRLSMGEGWN